MASKELVIPQLESSYQPGLTNYWKRYLIHRRIERWIHLQQFLHDHGNGYGYAFSSTKITEGGPFAARVFVQSGDLHWFGSAQGESSFQAISTAISDCQKVSGSASFRRRVRLFFRRLKYGASSVKNRWGRGLHGFIALAKRGSLYEQRST